MSPPQQEDTMMGPTFYVRHPDDSYTEAAPQPERPVTCGCPAGCHPLEHAMDWVLRRQDAPIPPMSMTETLKALRDALDDWRNR